MTEIEKKILYMYQAWSADKGLIRNDFISLVMKEFNWDREVATNMCSFLNSHIAQGLSHGWR